MREHAADGGKELCSRRPSPSQRHTHSTEQQTCNGLSFGMVQNVVQARTVYCLHRGIPEGIREDFAIIAAGGGLPAKGRGSDPPAIARHGPEQGAVGFALALVDA